MIDSLFKACKSMGLFFGLRFLFYAKISKWTKGSFSDEVFHWQSAKYIRRIINSTKGKKQYDFQLVAKRCDIKPNTCWVFWQQGIENAPLIVRQCYKSVKEHLKGFDIVVLNERNLFDYVCLPALIIQKLKLNKITITQFSDILRTYLLYFYGGLWLDATIMLSGDLPSCVKEADFFFFLPSVADVPYLPMSSWFFYAKKPFLPSVKKILDYIVRYWAKAKHLVDYFVFHIVIAILKEEDKDFAADWDAMPYLCNSEPHLLQRCLCRPFQKEKYEHIKSLSFCHKLTYKLEESVLQDKTNFYSFLCPKENKQEVSLQEYRKVLLSEFCFFASLCGDLHLQYFLYWGSLLGVIRHKGFIPWDDDIDVMMPRKDYEKLLEYFCKTSHPIYEIINNDTADAPYLISRLSDKRYCVVFQNDVPHRLGVFIDIYPYDNAGKTKKQAIRYCKKMYFLKTCFVAQVDKKNIIKRQGIKKIFVGIVQLLGKIGLFNAKKTIQKNIKKHLNDDTSQYVACTMWLDPDYKKEIHKKTLFRDLKQAPFENTTATIPVNYDDILKQMYGEYMTPPIKQEQTPHHNYKTFKKQTL